MPGHLGTGTDFELTTIKRLEALGYRHVFVMEIERQQDEAAPNTITLCWSFSRWQFSSQ
jgi:hypothetical protein